MGPYDLTLTLRRMAGISEGGVVYEPLARVTMSPQHAKVLSEVLAERVSMFEDVFGALLSNEAMREAGMTARERGEAVVIDDATEDDSPNEPEQPS